MIGMTVRLSVKEGQGEAFERAFAVQAKGVRANEPGNHLYELFKSRFQPDTYLVVEIYDDDAALAAHKEAPHMVANRSAIGPLVAGRPEVEAFDIVPHGD